MLKPLEQWYCDKCGEIIKSPREGYVIWKSDESFKSSGFKIIHQRRCDDKSYRLSSALQDFLGLRGITYLLTFLSLGPIKEHLGQGKHCDIVDMDEFVDFFRRVQLPYYEEARQHFGDPDILDLCSDWNELAPYLPEELKKLVERVNGK